MAINRPQNVVQMGHEPRGQGAKGVALSSGSLVGVRKSGSAQYRTYSLNLEFNSPRMGLASFADLDCERASAVDLWRRIAWFGDPAEGVKLG